MIREQIKKRRKHNPHINMPFVSECAAIKGLSLRHALYIMFMLYTEGGMRPSEISERVGISVYYVAAIMTRLRRRGMIKARFVDAYSIQKLYFVNDKNAFVMSILEHLSNKYGKVVIKGLSDYEAIMNHVDEYEKVVDKRKPKKARTKCQKK